MADQQVQGQSPGGGFAIDVLTGISVV